MDISAFRLPGDFKEGAISRSGILRLLKTLRLDPELGVCYHDGKTLLSHNASQPLKVLLYTDSLHAVNISLLAVLYAMDIFFPSVLMLQVASSKQGCFALTTRRAIHATLCNTREQRDLSHRVNAA